MFKFIDKKIFYLKKKVDKILILSRLETETRLWAVEEIENSKPQDIKF